MGKHGNRLYIQILLEPNRGELFLEEAKFSGKKPSALAREIIYEYIQENWPKKEEQAAIKDKQIWLEVVKTRLESRARNKALTVKPPDQLEDTD